MYKRARKALRDLQVCDVIYSYQSTYKTCPDVSSAVTLLTLELEEPKLFFICFSQKTPTESLCSYCLNTSFLLAIGFPVLGKRTQGRKLHFLLALEGSEPAPAGVLALPSLSPYRTAAASQPPPGSLPEFCFPYSHQNL